MTHKACKVCGGAGGWKVTARHWSDRNWDECLYCEGLGFVEVSEEQESPSFLLVYNGYRVIITNIMENWGKLISYQTVDQGSTIDISIVPAVSNKTAFAEFTKELLKFGHFNGKLKTSVNQVFFYEPSDGLYHYFWKITLNPTDITDLDGFVDLVRSWELKLRIGGRR